MGGITFGVAVSQGLKTEVTVKQTTCVDLRVWSSQFIFAPLRRRLARFACAKRMYLQKTRTPWIHRKNETHKHNYAVPDVLNAFLARLKLIRVCYCCWPESLLHKKQQRLDRNRSAIKRKNTKSTPSERYYTVGFDKNLDGYQRKDTQPLTRSCVRNRHRRVKRRSFQVINTLTKTAA